MPLLLEDLAEETSASHRRTADRLDEEMRELERLGQARDAHGLQQRAVASARQATDYAIAFLPPVEGIWRSALALLPTLGAADASSLLHHLQDIFEAGRRLTRSSRGLWNTGIRFGSTPERLDELGGTERRFEELAKEARRALEHRAAGWQPADPERLAEGLRLAREGKTVEAEEARAWFRPAQS